MAIWIALAAVFIALIPALIISSRKRAAGKHDRTRDGGADFDSGSSHGGSDGGGGDGGGGGD